MRTYLSLLALASLAVACGGSTVDVGDQKTAARDAQGRAVASPSPADPSAPAASDGQSATASADPVASKDPAIAALAQLAAASPTCTLGDVRGPFVFANVPTIALGLQCPATGAACYHSNAGFMDEYVCRAADGNVQCAFAYTSGLNSGQGSAAEGYDCCLNRAWGDDNTSQCFWLK